MHETNINSDIFHRWIVDDLLKKVPKNSVIVMDNASFHKRTDTKKSIEEFVHKLLYQPASSPQLNPIEKKWDYFKSLRKKLKISFRKLFDQFI